VPLGAARDPPGGRALPGVQQLCAVLRIGTPILASARRCGVVSYSSRAWAFAVGLPVAGADVGRCCQASDPVFGRRFAPVAAAVIADTVPLERRAILG
jgi:hypothetical protein